MKLTLLATVVATAACFRSSVLPSARRARAASVSMAIERTYIMIKPDGVQRGLVGNIVQRFEQRGYQLKALKLKQASEELLRKHYADLTEKKFFPDLLAYMLSGPSRAWSGRAEAVKMGRQMLGATNPQVPRPPRRTPSRAAARRARARAACMCASGYSPDLARRNRSGHDPRRLLDRGRAQHLLRLRLAGEVREGDRPLVRGRRGRRVGRPLQRVGLRVEPKRDCRAGRARDGQRERGLGCKVPK